MTEDHKLALALTRAEAAVSRSRRVEQLRESKPTRDAVAASAVDEIQTRTSEIVLLFLDLARITGDAAYLEVAKAGAKHLAQSWENLAANPGGIHAAIKPSSIANGLSRAAFALAETWKATKNPVYRDVGLNIIRCIAGMESPAAD
jgi:hypothetical protein